jgi:hypothetical protein
MERWLCDYDSTLANTNGARYDAVNAKFGTSYRAEDVVDWYWTQHNWPKEHNDWMWGPECFLSEEFQLSVSPQPNAVETLLSMRENGIEPMIVSDRPVELFDCTREWLDEHGLDMIRLLFTRHKHSLNMVTKGVPTKQQAAVLYRLRTVLEDAPHHALAFAEKDHIDQVYLFDRPYNQGIEHEKILRLTDWNHLDTLVTIMSLTGVLSGR